MNGLLKKAVAELLGVTVFLTAIISSTSAAFNHTPGFANVALGVTLGLMILVTASTSGGHLNPAVSLYFLAKKAISVTEFVTYVVAQLAGGFLGVALGLYLSGGSVTTSDMPASPSDIAGELVATAVLVWLVGHLAATDQGARIPFAVGAWVVAASLYTSTGAQANPAVTFGLLFAGKSISYVGVLILVQLVGALVAVALTMYVTGKAKK